MFHFPIKFHQRHFAINISQPRYRINFTIKSQKNQDFKCLKKNKGIIENISNNQLFVKGVAFNISELEALRVTFILTKIIGDILRTTRIFTTGIRIYIFAQLATQGAIAALIGILFDSAVSIVGILVSTVSISMFFIERKYKMGKGWQLKALQP